MLGRVQGEDGYVVIAQDVRGQALPSCRVAPPGSCPAAAISGKNPCQTAPEVSGMRSLYACRGSPSRSGRSRSSDVAKESALSWTGWAPAVGGAGGRAGPGCGRAVGQTLPPTVNAGEPERLPRTRSGWPGLFLSPLDRTVRCPNQKVELPERHADGHPERWALSDIS